MIHQPTFILSGVRSGLHASSGESAYAQYLGHLEKSSPPVQAARTEGTVEHFAQGYQDYLQNPLQVDPTTIGYQGVGRNAPCLCSMWYPD
ncbi:hypothetical protein SCLCIDRAFT_1223516 [Scleroderma citrinum Foug A]|uniref:Uncharacterized protein n=1 Tax=Scleroderma citrinum Foug A TaxID=1036808 RepID=A0A0C3D8I5_9AGAM|nr:hypothetical protein SCLCIDRAFT_1223516 [Scleroderma citrinum Foug A]